MARRAEHRRGRDPRNRGIHGSFGRYAAVGATFNLGTTALALNRASGAVALTGITSIDGNAATVTTNANLTGVITSVGQCDLDRLATGTGTKFVTDTSPTLVTPNIGVATATTVNKVTITAPAAGSTLTIANGKTLTVSNTLTLAGVDSSSFDVGVGGALWSRENNFRLSLVTGDPVSAADSSGGTLYFTPFNGNKIALYNGSTGWKSFTSAEMNIALAGTGLFDVFCYDNAGTPTLETLVWTSDTVRATALVRQDGVWVKSGATTRRYVGTVRVVAGTATDSTESRGLFNADNRQLRSLRKLAAGGVSWSYGTATIRQANGGTGAYQIEIVVGLAEDQLGINIGVVSNSAGSGWRTIGIGYDSTTTFNAEGIHGSTNDISNQWLVAGLRFAPAVGHHTLYWNENTSGTSVTFFADTASNGRGGMYGEMRA
jgi:hypothetical protein